MQYNKDNNNHFNYTNSYNENQGKNIFLKGKILLNGNKRTEEMENYYYELLQVYNNYDTSPSKGINLYSFSLASKIYQPSGSCNLSQFDEIQLDSHVDQSINRKNKSIFRSYALTYNVLRIIDGFGGVLFN